MLHAVAQPTKLLVINNNILELSEPPDLPIRGPLTSQSNDKGKESLQPTPRRTII